MITLSLNDVKITKSPFILTLGLDKNGCYDPKLFICTNSLLIEDISNERTWFDYSKDNRQEFCQ